MKLLRVTLVLAFFSAFAVQAIAQQATPGKPAADDLVAARGHEMMTLFGDCTNGELDFPQSEGEFGKANLRRHRPDSSEAELPFVTPSVAPDAWSTACFVLLKDNRFDSKDGCKRIPDLPLPAYLWVNRAPDADGANFHYIAVLFSKSGVRTIPLSRKVENGKVKLLTTGDTRAYGLFWDVLFADVVIEDKLKKYYVLEAYDPSDAECLKYRALDAVACVEPPGASKKGPKACVEPSGGRSVNSASTILERLQGSAGGGYEPPPKPPGNN